MDPAQLDSHRAQNRIHTIALLLAMPLLLAILSWSLFGLLGLLMAAGAALAFALLSPSISAESPAPWRTSAGLRY